MSDQQHVRGDVIPSEAFVKQVKDALEHVYDFPHLQRHPLAQDCVPTAEPSAKPVGQRLRQELLAAIETLSPGLDVSFLAPHARLYNLLHLHYVEGMTIQEVARELGLSERQTYRDLRRGEESVASVLWAWRPTTFPQEPDGVRIPSIQDEMAHLEPHPRPTDVRVLLQSAQGVVERMASQRVIGFDLDIPPNPVIVPVDPLVARQVLINLLSHSVQQARPGTLHLALTAGEGQASLTVCHELEVGAANEPIVSHLTEQLIDQLHWSLRGEDHLEGTRTVVLQMAAQGPIVLVIDDNEGLAELLERYLTDQACQVIAARDSREGLRLAQELMPDVIVLDVMMPEMDGWELLQRLRVHTEMITIPVVICSVFNDPELAYSLGASFALSKPITRDDVLTALRELGVV